MDEQTATPERQKQTKLIAGLAIGFGLFHGATLLIALLPGSWAINRGLDQYRHLTGTRQDWKMFSSIPRALDKTVTVEIRDAAGEPTVVGPILPGLEPLDIHSRVRYHSLLVRMMASDSICLGGYVEAIERAVVESHGADAREFSVITETEFIRLIKKINEDGKMTVRQVDELGPIPISAEK